MEPVNRKIVGYKSPHTSQNDNGRWNKKIKFAEVKTFKSWISLEFCYKKQLGFPKIGELFVVLWPIRNGLVKNWP